MACLSCSSANLLTMITCWYGVDDDGDGDGDDNQVIPLTRPSTLAILEPSKATAVIEDANLIPQPSRMHCREPRSIYLPAHKA